MAQGDEPFVKAARTSFEVLEGVRELDGAGISELARHLDRSKNGVYKHIKTLAAEGYLVQREDSYHVGLGTWALGTGALDHFPLEQGENAVDSLAASVDRTVSLVLYEEAESVISYVNEYSGGDSIGRSVGDRLPLHATAAGKVILAYAGEDTIERLIHDDLPSFTDETITDPDALRSELTTIRERRTAVDREEYAEGVECVAAPIVRTPGDPVGAITISGTTAELAGTPIETRVEGILVSASRSVENSLDDRQE